MPRWDSRVRHTVTLWDDSQGEKTGNHYLLGSGRPNARGDVVITFSPGLTFRGGLVYAEFVADDPATVNRARSKTLRYTIG